MQIRSRMKEYEVIMEQDLAFLNKLSKASNVQFVVDKKIYELYKDKFMDVGCNKVYLIEADEENKVMDTALDLCEVMVELPAKRNMVLVSVGGGIIQDITGFAANILYRGIKWIFVPTTLLAACDSCIGGKTSLNYKGYKNLLGTFYPPDEIHIAPSFFHTLSEKDYKSGLGEVVKFNLMDGEEGLDRITFRMDGLLERDESLISEFVLNSLGFKKGFIEVDEFDKGERIKLNFAHTFGHAIEVFTEYEIPHGTAVAIGMIIANRISVERGLLDSDFEEAAKNILLKVITIDIKLMRKPLDIIINAMRKDKKQTSDTLTAVLMTNIPKDLRIVHDIREEEVMLGFQYFCNVYETANS